MSSECENVLISLLPCIPFANNIIYSLHRNNTIVGVNPHKHNIYLYGGIPKGFWKK